MTDPSLPIYEAVYDYVEAEYKHQAAEGDVEWTQDHNEFVEAEVAGLYGQVIQAVETYMKYIASPLPEFDVSE